MLAPCPLILDAYFAIVETRHAVPSGIFNFHRRAVADEAKKGIAVVAISDGAGGGSVSAKTQDFERGGHDSGNRPAHSNTIAIWR